jgi:uncharacterized phage protein gp47/JayE
MAAPEILSSGIQVQTFGEAFADFVEGYQGIYGSDINLAQESPDGQRVAISATQSVDLQVFAAAIANQFDPDFATGQGLKRLAKFFGLYLNPSPRSNVELTVVASKNATLPAGYIRKDTLGQEWTILVDTAVTTGSNTVTFYSVEYGAIEALSSTITVQDTVIDGITSTTNASAATAGTDEETEAAFRLRRRRSTENAAYSVVGQLTARLLNISGVTDARVYENKSASYEAERDLQAHQIWCVVLGGTEADIIEVIAKNVTGGTPLKGGTSATYTETVYRPDGTSYNLSHTINYDRPTEVALLVRANATANVSGDTIDTDAIEAAIASGASYYINDKAYASSLYAFGYQAATNFHLYDLEIAKDAGEPAYTDEQLVPDYDEYFTIDVADVVVTEV